MREGNSHRKFAPFLRRNPANFHGKSNGCYSSKVLSLTPSGYLLTKTVNQTVFLFWKRRKVVQNFFGDAKQIVTLKCFMPKWWILMLCQNKVMAKTKRQPGTFPVWSSCQLVDSVTVQSLLVALGRVVRPCGSTEWIWNWSTFGFISAACQLSVLNRNVCDVARMVAREYTRTRCSLLESFMLRFSFPVSTHWQHRFQSISLPISPIHLESLIYKIF